MSFCQTKTALFYILLVLCFFAWLPATAHGAWGVQLSKDDEGGWGHVRLLAVSPNSAFRSALIYPGDVITAINGVSVVDLSLDQVVQMLKRSEREGHLEVDIRGKSTAVEVTQKAGQDKHSPFYSIGDMVEAPLARGSVYRQLTEREKSVLADSKHLAFATFGTEEPIPSKAHVAALDGIKDTVLIQFVRKGLLADFIVTPDQAALVNSNDGRRLVQTRADLTSDTGIVSVVDMFIRRIGGQRIDSIDELRTYRSLSGVRRRNLWETIKPTSVTRSKDASWIVRATLLYNYVLREVEFTVSNEADVNVTHESSVSTSLPTYETWRHGAYYAMGFPALSAIEDAEERAKRIRQAVNNLDESWMLSEAVVLTARHLKEPIPVFYSAAQRADWTGSPPTVEGGSSAEIQSNNATPWERKYATRENYIFSDMKDTIDFASVNSKHVGLLFICSHVECDNGALAYRSIVGARDQLSPRYAFYLKEEVFEAASKYLNAEGPWAHILGRNVVNRLATEVGHAPSVAILSVSDRGVELKEVIGLAGKSQEKILAHLLPSANE